MKPAVKSTVKPPAENANSLTSSGLPRYIKGDQSRTGGNALSPQQSTSSDNGGRSDSTLLGARTMSTKPNGNSGDIGSGQPLKTNSGYKEQNMPIGTVYKKTNPTRK